MSWWQHFPKCTYSDCNLVSLEKVLGVVPINLFAASALHRGARGKGPAGTERRRTGHPGTRRG